MHFYDTIPLHVTGYLLGLFLTILHLWMLLKQQSAQRFFTKFPRNRPWGTALMAIGIGWYWLYIIPPQYFAANPFTMDLGDFDKIKPLLFLVVPVVGYLMIKEVKDFLAVRALGFLALMAALPLLMSAFQQPPRTSLLIPIYAYGSLTAGMFCVGMPYLFRDVVTWACASSTRWKLLSLAGLGYGLAVLFSAFFFW